MKLVAPILLLAGLAQAQQVPILTPPTAVDVQTEALSWQPQGLAVSYVKKTKAGDAIGLYAMGGLAGQTVLQLGPTDRVERQWFDNQPAAIHIVYRDVVEDGKPAIQALVYLLDAAKGTAPLLWSQSFDAKQGIDVDVDTSPKIRHAVFRMKTGGGTFHMVLPSMGARLIPSKDLDLAAQSNLGDLHWSVDGTAIYQQQPEGEAPNQIVLNSQTGEASVRLTYLIASEVMVSGKRLWVAKSPAPEVGAPVLELMPSNAVLRNVRFKGEWAAPEKVVSPIVFAAKPSGLTFGGSNAAVNPLWALAQKSAQVGSLVAGHVDQFWVSPTGESVAYESQGALFIRSVEARDR